ncbi:succinyl-diaminopimelate desuccinylase [Entomobacter blattae]|uniref:Succinyl-diaminopimelate desuccinylase n=1 Tax=Entomobacter blattae TaxID=2762277 RepID=A0A7H1NSM6_9PROT|nr:succinyl-diaminopimelate desuccinylase [Entomobacter blattae]QNT78786.1 Succinyl-diaminopimelate desuccinylase [Entomobacter blattae]
MGYSSGSIDDNDVVEFAQALLKKASVTPADEGVQGILISQLERMGFSVTLLPFGSGEKKTLNFFARLGEHSPHICFAGHTDVVPPGGEGWVHAPFSGVVEKDILYGRGACDMKGGIAAFVCAVEKILKTWDRRKGSISFLITGDEEGTGEFGTKCVLEWMKAQNQIPDFCLVGEPTNPNILGETIKIGRRGSLNARVVIKGVQGHVAYPHRADNPLHKLASLLNFLVTHELDKGNEWFEPSSLQVTSIDTGNDVTNLIPGEVEIRLNIRFNTEHTGQSLKTWLNESIERFIPHYSLEVAISGEAFLTPLGVEVSELQKVILEQTGRNARLDTGGGTSDARFITHYCPVAEFGLVGQTMHKVNEQVQLSDLRGLETIYRLFLQKMLCGAGHETV